MQSIAPSYFVNSHSIFNSIAGMSNIIINFKELRIQELCFIDKLEFLLFTFHSQAIISVGHNVFSLQLICMFTVTIETKLIRILKFHFENGTDEKISHDTDTVTTFNTKS